jgi:hypothetical protein
VFRAISITNYLDNDGTIVKAQVIAAHESPRIIMLSTVRTIILVWAKSSAF